MEKNYTILIVDDMKANIDILYEMLHEEYNLKIALNGEVALKIAEKFTPDLILLDIMMPGIDGYEVCRRLKNNMLTKNIPLLFITAMTDQNDEARGFEVGAVDFIQKPIRPMVLKSRLKTHLELSDRRKELKQEVYKRTKELEDTRLEIIRIVGRAAEYKDNETGYHVIRVGEYCYTIARALGLDEYTANLLRGASQMHDVGKIGIPDSILGKPGRLDPEEWEIMAQHPQIGYMIFGKQASPLLRMAANVALEHHEKFDGSGYPYGKKGDDIAIESRIVALCDVFDALTSVRPYKEAWPIEKAIDFIQKERNQHFDGNVVDAFFASLDRIQEIYETYKE